MRQAIGNDGHTTQILLNLITSDEADFHLSGYVNKNNFRYWAEENLHLLPQSPLRSQQVRLWCGLSSFGMLRPYIFEVNKGHAFTVAADPYVSMLNEFLLPELRQCHNDKRLVWCQQDSERSHTERISKQTVREMFPGCVISRNGDVTWPPRSPDLSPCVFYLWRYLEHKVYETRPHTIYVLRDSIRTTLLQIPLHRQDSEAICRGLFAGQWSSLTK